MASPWDVVTDRDGLQRAAQEAAARGPRGFEHPNFGGLAADDPRIEDANTLREIAQQNPEAAARLLQEKGPAQERWWEAARTGVVMGYDFPGVPPSLVAMGLSREERAKYLMGQTIGDLEGVYGEQPGAEAYEYDPTLIEDVGWRPGDEYSLMGEADPLDVAAQKRTDETGVEAQRAALDRIEGALRQGGLSEIDQARIEESRQMRGQQARSREDAIMADMAEKGRAGGQAELLGRMTSNQAATQARSMDDLQTNAMALNRRDSLMGQQGLIGGQVQTAQDAIDKFNTTQANEGTFQEWQESNRREGVNVDTKNRGVDRAFDYETGLIGDNTVIQNEAKFSSATGQTGPQAHWQDKVQGVQDLVEQKGTVAAGIIGEQTRKDAAEAADREAILRAGLGVVEAATPFVPKFGRQGRDRD